MKKSAGSARVDMRGFHYALSPYVQQQEWHMETLQRQLAKAHIALMHAQDELAVMQTALQTQAAQIQQAAVQRPDPLAHRRGLEFLVSTRQRIEEQNRTIETLEAQKRFIQSECLAQQCKLDGLSEHHDQAQQEFAVEQSRQTAAEADRDWIGRMRHHGHDPLLVRDEP